jgi:signal transduction histidine kinase
MLSRNGLGDERIALLIEAIEHLQRGNHQIKLPTGDADELGRLGLAIAELARGLDLRHRALARLDGITARINAGVMLEEILDNVYQDFRALIPYNRIGLALLESEGQALRAHWAKSDQPVIRLGKGYCAPMAGSSLEGVIATGRPRILNDLVDYLSRKPDSESTRLVVEEGIRSSLTCPLIANGMPIGFLFFSSVDPHAYEHAHVEAYQRVAQHLSVSVEKGRLVSELAAQKTALQKQNEELLRLNELKNSFLGMAAHDLRNPIGIITLTVSMLAEDQGSLSREERTAFLSDIKKQTEQMLALLDSLLDVSRIEAGKFTVQMTSLRLCNFLDESVRRHARLAEVKGTQVRQEDVPDCEVQADPTRLRQIMDNLISNAVKFSPAGSTVTVAASANSAEVRVEVRDQGPGVTGADRELLFHDFARLTPQPTGGESSTGLGLAITKRIVEAHGGRIGVESEPGKGATFWFTLRRADAGPQCAHRQGGQEAASNST